LLVFTSNIYTTESATHNKRVYPLSIFATI